MAGLDPAIVFAQPPRASDFYTDTFANPAMTV
jgi:hypothetical protein